MTSRWCNTAFEFFLDMFKRYVENDESQNSNNYVGYNQKLNKTFILKHNVNYDIHFWMTRQGLDNTPQLF